MPDGFNTQVGELGNNLSGGEKQRILIARALLKDAQIYLFDEATSSLDSETESQITDELDEYFEGKTVIYSAHRLASIKNVDKIHVMQDGQVAEQGTHDELMEKDSIYKKMWLEIE